MRYHESQRSTEFFILFARGAPVPSFSLPTSYFMVPDVKVCRGGNAATLVSQCELAPLVAVAIKKNIVRCTAALYVFNFRCV